jgi:hypothetical protein
MLRRKSTKLFVINRPGPGNDHARRRVMLLM